jgi:methionyl aminopeptidase
VIAGRDAGLSTACNPHIAVMAWPGGFLSPATEGTGRVPGCRDVCPRVVDMRDRTRMTLTIAVAVAVGVLIALWRQRMHNARTLEPRHEVMAPRHSADTLRRMALPRDTVNREAARIAVEVSRVVAEVGSALVPGQSTLEIAERVRSLLPRDMTPVMLGLNGFPAAAAVSVNEEVVHAIPSEQRRIKAGDLVRIQFSAGTDVAFGAIGWTFPVGELAPEAQRLHDVGLTALRNAIALLRAGVRTGDIGAEIQETVESEGFSVVRDYVGYTMGCGAAATAANPVLRRAWRGPATRSGYRSQPACDREAGRLRGAVSGGWVDGQRARGGAECAVYGDG